MQVIPALRTSVGFTPAVKVPPPAGPLRVALAIESLGLGGAEMVVLQLAEELRRRGHSVIGIGPDDRDGWLKDCLRATGTPYFGYRLRSPRDWGCAVHFSELLTREKIDILHSHEFVTSVFGAAGARLAGVHHVNTMHGSEQMTRKWQRRVALRWAVRRSEHTIAVSADTKDHLVASLNVRDDEIGVIRNGVPDVVGDGPKLRSELGVTDSQLLILAVGSLVQRKGHRFLLDAVRELDSASELPSWKVAIAGEGEERSALEASIRSYGLTNRVVLLGNRADVADLQAAADIFVMPSLWEGLPLAVLEAMFAGNPILATTTSGIPEAIVHNESGLLVPGGSARALASELIRLLREPGLRKRLGIRARSEAKSRFSISAMTDSYEQRYRFSSL